MIDARVIYLDYAASTPIDPRVLEVMLPWLASCTGNPQARHHEPGAAAFEAVQAARMKISARIGAAPEEIIFTSGATEANNLVLKGLVRYLRTTGKTHVITSAIEHSSVLEPLRTLEDFSLTSLVPTSCGLIESSRIERALTDKTGLVVIQAVNNETGTIQPLTEISAMLAGRDVLFHTDAVQALGKMPFDVRQVGVDFASFSAHKAYGPQGIGALYVRTGRKNLLKPLHHGGGNDLRPGTPPVALCVGFGAACTLIEDDRHRLQALRAAFLQRFISLKPDVYSNRQAAWNVPGILNIGFLGIDSEALVMSLPQLAFGTGAACMGKRHSHVIEALTGSAKRARESIRLSFGRFTTMEEIKRAADQIISAVTEMRSMPGAA